MNQNSLIFVILFQVQLLSSTVFYWNLSETRFLHFICFSCVLYLPFVNEMIHSLNTLYDHGLTFNCILSINLFLKLHQW